MQKGGPMMFTLLAGVLLWRMLWKRWMSVGDICRLAHNIKECLMMSKTLERSTSAMYNGDLN